MAGREPNADFRFARAFKLPKGQKEKLNFGLQVPKEQQNKSARQSINRNNMPTSLIAGDSLAGRLS